MFIPEFSPIHSTLFKEVFKMGGFDINVVHLDSSVGCNKLSYKKQLENHIENFVLKIKEKIFSKGINPWRCRIMLFEWESPWETQQNITFLKEMLEEHGLKNIEVVEFGFFNLKLPFLKFTVFNFLTVKRLLLAIFYSDILNRSLLAIRVGERIPDSADLLCNEWMKYFKKDIKKVSSDRIKDDLVSICIDFNFLKGTASVKPELGAVGDCVYKHGFSEEDGIIHFTEKSGHSILPASMINKVLFCAQRELDRLHDMEKSRWKTLILRKFIDWMNGFLEKVTDVMDESDVIISIPNYLNVSKKFYIINSGENLREGYWAVFETLELLETGVDLIMIPSTIYGLPQNTKGLIKKIRKVNENVNILSVDSKNVEEIIENIDKNFKGNCVG